MEMGDETPIHWLHKEERYGERLAPGSKITDIIGDIDPAKIIDSAIKEVFMEYFPIKKYESIFESIAKQIFDAGHLEISDGMPLARYRRLMESAPALFDLLQDQGWNQNDNLLAAGVEFILEGLTVNQMLSRRKLGEIVSFKSVDVY